MIEVRIRCDYDAEPVRLCEWPATDLDSLLSAIGCWGIYCNAGDYRTDDLTGQIVFSDRGAFFEIIVNTEE